MACPGLAFALLEVALDNNLDHPADEIEKLRTQLGLPPIQASWVEWFATGRKYQTARLFDWTKPRRPFAGAWIFWNIRNRERFIIWKNSPTVIASPFAGGQVWVK